MSSIWNPIKTVLLAVMAVLLGLVILVFPVVPELRAAGVVATLGSADLNHIRSLQLQPQRDRAAVDSVAVFPATGPINLAVTWPSNGVAVSLLNVSGRHPLSWTYANGHLQLEPPDALSRRESGTNFQVETADRSGQFPDGRIVFVAGETTGEGNKDRSPTSRASEPASEVASSNGEWSWNYRPTRWGRYDVELIYAADGSTGIEVECEIAGHHLRKARPPTGGSARYRPLALGRIYIDKAEPFTVHLTSQGSSETSATHLKALLLHPAPEGEPIQQEDSGEVTLRARDAITHGTVLRYEPATNKNCLGYWVNPKDWAEWEFTLRQPGRFKVELWQGCGPGQGGSEVAVESASRRLTFTVDETGHFQNFVPRSIGQITFDQPGRQTLAVRPLRKQAAAVMDIREIRLVPMREEAAP